MNDPIRWGKKNRPRKDQNGHTPLQYGRMDFPRFRTFVRCECGVWLSGQGSGGGLDSWRKHVKREAVKRATPNP